MDTIAIHLIPQPLWSSRPHSICIEAEFGYAEFLVIQSKWNNLLPLLNSASEEYLQAFYLDSGQNTEDTFPDIKQMTGEYYIADQNYDCRLIRNKTESQYVISIMLHFLEYPREHTSNQDYLGIEVLLYWDKDNQTFIFDGINTSSI